MYEIFVGFICSVVYEQISERGDSQYRSYPGVQFCLRMYCLCIENPYRPTRQFLHAPAQKLEQKAKSKDVNKYDHERMRLYLINLQHRYNPRPQKN